MLSPQKMSNSSRPSVSATDVLLAGDILRVAYAGLPILSSSGNAVEALAELRMNHEPFRSFLNQPPHGNSGINSCLLYPSSSPDIAGTLFLASQFAYAPLAGTALMAAACTLFEQGFLSDVEAEAPIRFQTANGLSDITLSIKNDVAVRAEWKTLQPRILAEKVHVQLENGRTIAVTLTSSGLPYIVVLEDDLAVSIDDHVNLGPAAAALSEQVSSFHPTSQFGIEGDYSPYLVMVVSRVSDDHVRTVWISDKGLVAHSPGGTGALCVVAALEARKLIQDRSAVIVESPGGAFDCRISDSHATVSSSVHTVAHHEFLDPPLKSPEK